MDSTSFDLQGARTDAPSDPSGVEQKAERLCIAPLIAIFCKEEFLDLQLLLRHRCAKNAGTLNTKKRFQSAPCFKGQVALSLRLACEDRLSGNGS